MSITRTGGPATVSLRSTVLLGFAAIIFDGYDLIVYGSTIPVLLAQPDWHLTPGDAGHIGSLALLGMFCGALLTGALTDRFGRRLTFIASLSWFSLMMIGTAAAPSPEMLGLFRFMAGLGFGGIAPTAIALVVEAAPPSKRNLYNALMLAGFPLGGILAGFLAVNFLDSLGFRGLYLFGAIPLITLVPAAYFLLPETADRQGARLADPNRMTAKDLLVGKGAITTLLFALANFVGFLLVFGLNTWLPQLMRQAGYDLGSAVKFLIALNVGAVIGGIVGSFVADKRGSKYVASAYFVVAALALAALATDLPTGIVFLVVVLAGAAAVGNQIVVYGFVATSYTTEVRATALGLTSGIGRLGAVAGPSIGGYLLDNGYGLSTNVLVFAGVAAAGALACVLVRTSGRRSIDCDRLGDTAASAPASS